MLSNWRRQMRFDQERLHFTSGAVNNLRPMSAVESRFCITQKRTSRRTITPLFEGEVRITCEPLSPPSFTPLSAIDARRPTVEALPGGYLVMAGCSADWPVKAMQ